MSDASNQNELENLMKDCLLLPQWVKDTIQNGWNGKWHEVNGQMVNGYIWLNGE